jgi:RNA polymerase primary sigma factor
MAIKKKTKKKPTSSKKAAGRKVKPTQKRAQKARTAKKSAKRASALRKTAAKKKKSSKKATSPTTSRVSSKQTRVKPRGRRGPAFSSTLPGSRSGEESGDLQGLSDVESADSESVDELLEEGNAFEAGVVSGVEEADRRDEKGVRTREVPEDDVPQEYLDEE